MKFFIAVVTLALCASALADEEEKNVDKRTVIVGSYGIDDYYRSLFYSSYYPVTGVRILKKRDTAAVENAEEEKDVDKRAVIVGGYNPFISSLYYPSYYNYARLYKRDTAAVEENTEEKNVDKRAIVYEPSVWYRSYYPYNYPIVTYPYLKRETEEASEGEHNVQKREVSEDEPKTENKRDLYLGYGSYYNYYRSFPYYKYYGYYY